MQRIANRFAELKEQGKTALIPYFMAADPNPETSLLLLHEAVRAGASLLEVGLPFSDPVADGPAIQEAAERAIKQHIGGHEVLALTRQFRATDKTTPIVLMGYMNSLEALGGPETFVRAAAQAGVDGLLIVDLPFEEAHSLRLVMKELGMALIALVAPTTNATRMQRICAHAEGFIYCISRRGTTGKQRFDQQEVAQRITLLRRCTKLPIAVGFGIQDGDDAARLAPIADGVVIGSALLSVIQQRLLTPDALPQHMAAILSTIRSKIDATSKQGTA